MDTDDEQEAEAEEIDEEQLVCYFEQQLHKRSEELNKLQQILNTLIMQAFIVFLIQ